ncbi:MAG TPA: CHAT domain-containing protein, partial [Myxococcota bacterium]|nr:CHAT domain-containing protein [Myxococcota bacterium]
DPALSPDGARLAFASLRLDSKGDLFLAGPDGERPERLTTRETSDRQPAFFPDGQRLAFTSSAGAEPEAIHSLSLEDRRRARLSSRPGFDPAVSPDGALVLFTSRTPPAPGGGAPAVACLWLHRLADGLERPLHACVRPEGFGTFARLDGATWVVWSRFQDDTNGDGQVDLQDRPSLWRQRLVDFSGDTPQVGPLTPLTPGTSADITPTVHADALVYASRQDEDLDLWTAPLAGALAPVASGQEALRQAEQLEDPLEALFLLRRCAADRAGLPDADACALAEAGRLLTARRTAQAAEVYAALAATATAPEVRAEAGLGQVEAMTQARLPLGLTPSQQRERAPEGEALLARLEGLPGPPAARALARADIQRRIGRWGEALAELEGLLAASGLSDTQRARALLLRSEVLRVLGNPEAARQSLLEVLARHPAQRVERLEAARQILDLARQGGPLAGAGQGEVERLEELARDHAELPLLAALVRLEIGRLHRAAGQPELAARDFRRVEADYPQETELCARALLALSDLAEKRGDVGQALDHAQELLERYPDSVEQARKARRRVRQLAGAYAEDLVSTGETGLAIKVYRQLLEQDPDDVVAHRQLIAMLAARGRAAEAVATYRAQAAARPGDDLSIYLQALALTYLEPPEHFDEAEDLLEQALAINEQSAFAHQTRAWLLEQRAHLAGGDEERLMRAAEEYQAALALLDTRAYPGAAADLELNLGNVYHALGNHRRAHQFYKRREAMEIPFALPERRLVFLEQFGRSAFLCDELEDAARAYAAAAPLARELKRTRRLPRILAGQAAALQLQGRHAEAAELFRKVCKAYGDSGQRQRLASCQRNVAYNLYKQGRAREAAEAFAEARSLLERHGAAGADDERVVEVGLGAEASRAASGFDRAGELNFLSTYQARLFREAGDTGRAAAALGQKLELLEAELGARRPASVLLDLAIATNQLAVLQLEQGQELAAARGFARSGRLSDEVQNAQGISANALNRLRLALTGRAGLEPGALVAELEAVRARLAAGLNSSERVWIELLAGLGAARVAALDADPRPPAYPAGAAPAERLRLAGEELDRVARGLRSAEAELREALSRARALAAGSRDGARLLVQVAASLAGVLTRLGHEEEAAALVAEARRLADGLALWEVAWRLPDGEPAARARALLELPPTLTRVRGDGAAEEAGGRLFGGLLRQALAEGRPDEALGWAEAWRLRLRVEALGPGDVRAGSEADRAWLEQLEMHAQVLVQGLDSLDPGLPEKQRAERWAEAAARLQAWRELRDRGGQPREVLREMLQGRAAGVEELGRLLEPGEALLTAARLADGLALFLLDANGLQAEWVEVSPAELNAALGRLTGPDPAQASGARAQLSAWLLKPFEARLAGCRSLLAATDELGLSPALLVLGGKALVQLMPVAQLGAASDLRWARRFRSVGQERALWVGASPPKAVGRALLAGYGALRELTGTAESVQQGLAGAGLAVWGTRLLASRPRPLRSSFELDAALGGLGGVPLGGLAGAPLGHGLWILAGGEARTGAAPGEGLSLALAGAEVPSALVLPLELSRPWAAGLFEGLIAGLSAESPTEALRGALDKALRERQVGWQALLGVELRGDPGMGEASRKAFAQREIASAIKLAMQTYQDKRWADSLGAFLKVRRLAVYLGQTALLPRLDAAIVQSAFQLGEYALAVEVERRILTAAEATSDKLAAARARNFLGVLLSKAEEHPAALGALAQAVGELDGLSQTAEAAQAQANLVLALDAAARYPESVEAARGALARFKALGDREQVLRMLRTLGATHLRRLNMTAAARGWFEQALALARELGVPARIGEVSLDLVRTELAAGAYEAALGRAKEAEGIYQQAGDRRGQAEAVLEQAGALWYLGEYQRAFLAQRQALTFAEEAEDTLLGIRARSLGGLIALNLGDLPGAERALDAALQAARRMGFRAEEATQLNNLGIVAREKGDLDQAVERFAAALAIDEQLKSVLGRAYDLRNLGLAEQLQGRLEQATLHLEEALQLSRSVQDVFNEVKARVGLAALELARGRLEQAADHAQEAHRLSVQAGLRDVSWRALRTLGLVAERQGRLPDARAHYAAAIGLVEEMRASLKVEEFRSGFLDSKFDLYEDMIHLLVELGESEAAFAYTERSRARGFLDLLANRQIEVGIAGDQVLLERLRRAREELVPLGEAVRRAAPEERAAAEADLARARQEYLDLLEQMRRAQPDLADFVEVRPASAAEIQARLPEGVALLAYYVTRRDVLVFVLRRDGLGALKLPISREELARRVAEVRSLIEAFSPVEAELTALYRDLVAPLADDLGGLQSVGVLPHDVLNYLPFAALMPGPGVYWGDRVELFVDPSASVLMQLLHREDARFGPAGGLVALGNPELGDPALALPFAEQEAAAVGFEQAGGAVLVAQDASEAAFRAQAGRADLLHLACHGSFDPQSPLFSSLLLTPGDGQDGALTALEVFGLALSARLVTLSACQSGLGSLRSGDEIIGLNRAFLSAGAGAVLSSLWRVSDVATAVMMKRFYRNLRQEPPAAALRRAQRLVRQYFPHPAYWAPFYLLGTWR